MKKVFYTYINLIIELISLPFKKLTKKQLTEEYITEYADLVDWEYVSMNIHIPNFSDEFFVKFKYDIEWVAMAWYNSSMTTEFAHSHEKEIGYKAWYQNGELHRIDGPAVVYADGTKYWYKNGNRHRENGPAVIYPNGNQHWYQNGKLHRDNGPAIIRTDGSGDWYKNGIFIK